MIFFSILKMQLCFVIFIATYISWLWKRHSDYGTNSTERFEWILIYHHMHTVDRKIPTYTSTLILTLAIDPQSSTSFYAIKAKFVFQLGAKSEPVQVLILAQLSHGCIWIVKLEFFFSNFHLIKIVQMHWHSFKAQKAGVFRPSTKIDKQKVTSNT